MGIPEKDAMRHASLLMVTAAMLALPMTLHAQTSTTRVVPQNRPDQNPRVLRPRGGPGPQVPRGRMRSTPVSPFVLREVRLEGSTLPPAVIDAAWRPFVGKTVDTRDLVKITDALASAYARRGYAIYTVVAPD